MWPNRPLLSCEALHADRHACRRHQQRRAEPVTADIAYGDPHATARQWEIVEVVSARLLGGVRHPCVSEPRAGGRAGREKLLLDLAGDLEPDLQAVFLGASPLFGKPMFHLTPFVFEKLLGLPPDLLSRPMQVDKHLDLRSQHLGHDRREQKVDPADRGAPKHLQVWCVRKRSRK